MDRPTADVLMRQAPATIQLYLCQVVDDIDGLFGLGYAREHPELVAACVSSCARDFHTAMLVQLAEDVTRVITEG